MTCFLVITGSALTGLWIGVRLSSEWYRVLDQEFEYE